MPARIADLLTMERLTAPHYLAYSWVMKHVFMGDNVLDFGARYSLLPTLLRMKGCEVWATDRDSEFVAHQVQLARDHGVDPPNCVLVNDMGMLPAGRFRWVTACWAIQHNHPMAMPWIMRSLAAQLVLGLNTQPGKLLIVSSFTPGESFHQANRADPQYVLNWSDHERFIIGPSGLQLCERQFFRYEHGTNKGEYLSDADGANAVAYALERKPWEANS